MTSVYRFGKHVVDIRKRELIYDGLVVSVEPKVLDLLVYLIQTHGRVVSRDEIVAEVWDGRVISDAAISSCVSAARAALGDDGTSQTYIKTVHGKGFRFLPKVAEEPAAEALTNRSRPIASKPNRTPAIATCPFSNLSGDATQDYLCQGIVEDICALISRSHNLVVISLKGSGASSDTAQAALDLANECRVDYLLRGSFRKSGNQVRISANLTEVETAHQFWSERFECELEDILALQDEISMAIAVAVEPEIQFAERSRAQMLPTNTLGAWELVQRGNYQYYQGGRDNHLSAIDLFRQATLEAGDFASAHAHLAFTLITATLFDHVNNASDALSEAQKAADTAAKLDRRDPLARYCRGRLFLINGLVDLAREEMRAAIEINPNYAGAHQGLGHVNYYGARDAKTAVGQFDKALQLNPHAPINWATLQHKGSALRYLGRLDEAIDTCRLACAKVDCGHQAFLSYAASLAEADRVFEAYSALQSAKDIEPRVSLDFVRAHALGVDTSVLESYLTSLAKAGLQ